MVFKLIGKVGPYDTKTETDAKILVETNARIAADNTERSERIDADTQETNRAKAAESNLQTNIDTVSSAVATETTRAQNAEKELSDSIGQLESELTTKATTTEVQTVKNDLGDLGDQVSNIESKIPAKATAQNQLATLSDVQAGGGLSEVIHNDTLSGKGTSDSPLGVVKVLPAGGLLGQVLTKTDTGEAWDDVAGLEGDYCTKYGIVDETKSGLPTIVSGSTVKIPAQLVLDVPGVPGLTTSASDITYEIKSTIDCTLFLANGEILEATDVFFQKSEPEDGTTGYAAWWNGSEWKFKSNDTGNVFRPANAVRIAKCVFTNGSLTRLCFTGCRVLNKQEYATKEQMNNALATKADAQTVSSLSTTVAGLETSKAAKASDFITPITNANKGATKTEIDALDNKINVAATSGTNVGSYWFGKTKADTTVPAPTLPGQNYYDFTTGQVYKSTDGATWTLDTTNTPPTDIDVQILITSKFWDITEQENQHGGEAKWSHTNSEWSYFPKMYEDIPAGGASLPLLTRLISDHKFNDISYLDANTFSWQSGSVYKAVYQHLVKDMASKRWGYAWNNTEDTVRWYTKSRNPKVGDYAYDWGEIYDNASVPSNLSHTVKEYDTTNDSIKIVSGGASFAFSEAKTKNAFNLDSITETIEGIEITYFVAEDGHRICLPDQETAISNLYAKTGKANFFILDTANAQFKLPRTQKRKLLRAVKNGDSWYNLYSDGWVEQGGCVLNAATGAHTITIPIEMADVEQLKKATIVSPIFINGTIQNQGVTVRNSSDSTWSTNQIDCFSWGATIHIRWQVSGYAAESVLANEPVQHEYYYVGNFERSAIQQTAGLNAELFNNKVDVGHQIIDFQAPTAENNYTWYRKYADGWVEQGGYVPLRNSGVSPVSVTFAVRMANNIYTALTTPEINESHAVIEGTSGISIGIWQTDKLTTGCKFVPGYGSGGVAAEAFYWEVKGMAL